MRGLADSFHRRGHEVHTVYRGNGPSRNYLVFSVLLFARMMVQWPRLPDYLIARSTDGCLCAFVAGILRLRTRVVLHNHGWEERVHELGARQRGTGARPLTTWKSTALRFPLLRATLRMSRLCLCGTLDDIRWLRGRYPAQAVKMRYVPNGVSVAHTSAYWPSQSSRPPAFLCVGGSPWRKNIARSLELFAAVHPRLPRARLTLVGTNVSSPDIPPIPPAIAHAVVNVPQVSLERMEDWYRQCPYMITSTRYEGGHALTILEAMSFGCVVFASAIPAAREIIRHRHNGILLKGGRVDDDAEVIRDVVADRSLVDALGRHGFGTAQRNRWERQGERLMRVLERDRDGKAPGRGKTRAR